MGRRRRRRRRREGGGGGGCISSDVCEHAKKGWRLPKRLPLQYRRARHDSRLHALPSGTGAGVVRAVGHAHFCAKAQTANQTRTGNANACAHTLPLHPRRQCLYEVEIDCPHGHPPGSSPPLAPPAAPLTTTLPSPLVFWPLLSLLPSPSSPPSLSRLLRCPDRPAAAPVTSISLLSFPATFKGPSGFLPQGFELQLHRVGRALEVKSFCSRMFLNLCTDRGNVVEIQY